MSGLKATPPSAHGSPPPGSMDDVAAGFECWQDVGMPEYERVLFKNEKTCDYKNGRDIFMAQDLKVSGFFQVGG